MKIRIFALAKELDMDSKLLIDFCAKAGITIKNSALASISPEERDRVLGLIQDSGGNVNAVRVTEEAPAPMREYVPEVAGKGRPIRSMSPAMAPRSFPPRIGGAPATPSKAPVEVPASALEPEEVAAVESAEVVVQPELEEEFPSPVGQEEFAEAVADEQEESTSSAEMTAAADEEQAITDDGERLEDAVPSEDQDEREQQPSAEAQTPAGDQPVAPGRTELPPEKTPAPSPTGRPAAVPPGALKRPAKLTRGDYVPASGTLQTMRSLRPMEARGTLDSGRKAAPAQPEGGAAPVKKAPKKQAAPLIAAIPEFKGPANKPAKPEEQKAQKPEIRLSESILKGQSPLTDHMRKAAEKKNLDDINQSKRDGRRMPVDRTAGLGIEESRAQRRDKRRQTSTVRDDDGEQVVVKKHWSKKRIQPGSVQFKTSATVELPITVRSLSEAMGRPAKQILQILFKQGSLATINSPLEEEEAIELAMELGVELTIEREADLEQILVAEFAEPDAPELLQERPPIITILGHVDHGKTTLIDRLRSSNVAGGEHGGITQHIAAYQVDHNGKKLTFVDTPGHAAFGEMRARGANVTDIVVLVVAANDGVMPQTVECIAHARAAGVPLVVAMNKVDLPDKNEQKVLQELAAQNVLASEWGGDVEVVRTSGLTGQGLDDLLDTLLLTAELHEYRGNPSRDADGVCLESFRDEGRGPIAWMIVRNGSLRIGDVILAGESYGRIRMMYDEHDREVSEAPPSSPVKVAGLDLVPKAGDHFYVLPDVDIAREIAEMRHQRDRTQMLASRGGRRTLDDILQAAREGAIQDLNLIVKADTPGSLEALRGELGKFEHPEVRVKVLHDGVGGVNESDVYLAAASDAVIVAFHVIAEDRAQQLASQEGVEIRRYNIIYEVIDEIRQTLEGMLKPMQKQVTTGRAIVLRVFNTSKSGAIAGCRVLNGTIDRSNRVHLIRDQKILNDYSIGSLRREKEDVKEVREGMECGIRLENFSDVKEGDLFEAYKIEEVRRTLDS